MQQILRPRKIGEILNDAFEVYRRHWATLTGIAALFVVPLSFLQYYLVDLIRAETPARGTAQGVESFSATFWQASAALAVLGILTLFITQVVQGAITRAAAGSTLDDPMSLGEAYRYGFARMGSVLLVAVLVVLAVIGGLILLIIPGIVVMVRLASSVPVLVVEGKRGRAALSRSWNLTRGHGWHVFGTLLVAAILMGIATSIFTVPFDQGWAVEAIGAALGAMITLPYAAVLIVHIYLDLRAREEETEIAALRREFEASGIGGEGR